MNIYALFPLIATITYIPLLGTTISSRPWQSRHKLFLLFLIAAMLWSLTDVFLRSNLFPQLNYFLLQVILVTFAWTAVQLHCFTSSFFARGQGRWLAFAYASLAAIIALVLLRYIPEGVTVSGDKLYLDYGKGVIFLALPLLTLAGRNLYVFYKRLRILDNPVLYNQIISLRLAIYVMIIFGLAAIIPWGRELPISHFGNLINAFILSFATIRHQLVDIRVVLRRGLAWISIGIVGAIFYWLLLSTLHTMLHFELDLTATFIATMVAFVAAAFVYNLRGVLFTTIGKAFQRQSYDYRQQLSDFAGKIHHVFSLSKQGAELLTLVTKAVGCRKAGLLFFEVGSEDFVTQLIEPSKEDNPLSSLRLRSDSPIVEYLRRERKPLTRENLAILPEFRSLWTQEKEEIKSTKIELFMPLISRDNLTGILALDKSQSGRYSLEDFHLLEDVTRRVAISMEKEYLREQLRKHEEELSVLNRSSAIITSSLNIQTIYGRFIEELKKLVDVRWAAIVLIEESEMYLLALSSDIGSAWQVGERIPIKGTATEWVATQKKAFIESDLSQESRFPATEKYLFKQGVRSIAYLPLIARSEVIGSLVVASCYPNAYNRRHTNLLEQLASQIAMPIENTRLYAKVEYRARIDELTGLLNRRSLNELIASEIGRHSRYGGILSLIILDLDSFKAYNDSYGHLAGDKLLRQIGNAIKNPIRSADQAFRYGGDEFAVLMPQTPIEAGYLIAERVRQRVASESKAGYIPVTASLGLASWPADGIGPDEIIAAADAALYRAKRSGGNQSHRASGAMLVSDNAIVGNRSNEDSKTLSTIYALAAAVDAKDHYSRAHSKEVSKYAVALAEALNLEPLKISELSSSALLHDIGKIGISDEILNKQDRPTPEEWEIIKTHPELGATIASNAQQLAPCVPGILYHHERYDGTGYPKGLKGEDIPLEARILALADAFAAMTSERPYSSALSYREALDEIRQNSGTQFDPKLVEVFLSIAKTIPHHQPKREYEEVK